MQDEAREEQAPEPAESDGAAATAVAEGPPEEAAQGEESEAPSDSEEGTQGVAEGEEQDESLNCPSCEVAVEKGHEKCANCGTRLQGRDEPDNFTEERPPIKLRSVELKNCPVQPGDGGQHVLKLALEQSTADVLENYLRLAPYKGTRMDVVLIPPAARVERPHPQQMGLDEAADESPDAPDTVVLTVDPTRADEFADAECAPDIGQTGRADTLVEVDGSLYLITAIAASDPITFEAWRAVPFADIPEDAIYVDAVEEGNCDLDGLLVHVGADEGENRFVLQGPSVSIVVAASDEDPPDTPETPEGSQD